MGRLKRVQRALITHIESNIGRKSGRLSTLDLASIAKGSAPAELDELGAATLAIAATSVNNAIILGAMNGLPADLVAVLVERIKLVRHFWSPRDVMTVDGRKGLDYRHV